MTPRLTTPLPQAALARTLALVGCLTLLAACGGSNDSDGNSGNARTNPTRSSTGSATNSNATESRPDQRRATPSNREPASEAPTDPEYKRHFRLGVEQLRRRLFESAAAEFDRCAEIHPDRAELAFQRARLAWAEEGLAAMDRPPKPEPTIALLDRAITLDPAYVPARRMRWELARAMGDSERIPTEQRALAATLGAFTQTEMATYETILTGDMTIKVGNPPEGSLHYDDERAFVDAIRQLFRNEARYDPNTAVPKIEKIFERHPHLVATRMFFASLIVQGQIRVESRELAPDLPPMSSMFMLDMAQSHYERAVDQINPRSAASIRGMLGLASVAMEMGDYDEVLLLTELLLGEPRIPAPMREDLLERRALAYHKQERYADAITFYERALEAQDRSSPVSFDQRWLLHLAHDAAGTPAAERGSAFELRDDLGTNASLGASTSLAFVDIAPALGIDKLDGLGPSAWNDVDGDGDEDLYVCGCDSYGALYRNDGERFTDVSRDAGLFHTQSGYSATLADVDEDGDPDLYIGRDGWNGAAPNALYTNDGQGVFTDATRASGLVERGNSFVHVWLDYDRDGDLDVCLAGGITGGGDTNRLYANDGTGRFTDVTERAGLQEPSGTKTIGIAVGDYDDDGWPDLFVSGYRTDNRLYRNRGDGTFENVAASAGVTASDALTSGYVSFFFDYDADGDLDILRTALAPWPYVLEAMARGFDFAALPADKQQARLEHAPKLFRNDGDGTFTDVSVAAGFVHPIGIMGANIGDFDNDGYVDVYFGTGDPAIGRMEPDRFYRNQGDGTFRDATFVTGLGNVGKGHGVTVIDYDHDGDLDIYAPEGGFVHGDPWHNAFYRNDQNTKNHWLTMALEGPGRAEENADEETSDAAPHRTTRDAIGTRVTIRAGDRIVLRELKNGEGFGSTNSRALHFGLGGETKGTVTVRWPSGRVQTFEDVAFDRHLRLREGGSLEVAR